MLTAMLRHCGTTFQEAAGADVSLLCAGQSEPGSSCSSCTGMLKSVIPSGMSTPGSSASRVPSLTLGAGVTAEASSSCSSRASRGSWHAYVYCTYAFLSSVL